MVHVGLGVKADCLGRCRSRNSKVPSEVVDHLGAGRECNCSSAQALRIVALRINPCEDKFMTALTLDCSMWKGLP